MLKLLSKTTQQGETILSMEDNTYFLILHDTTKWRKVFNMYVTG
jgi:hypothetical protein